jgi:hypothetical protein
MQLIDNIKLLSVLEENDILSREAESYHTTDKFRSRYQQYNHKEYPMTDVKEVVSNNDLDLDLQSTAEKRNLYSYYQALRDYDLDLMDEECLVLSYALILLAKEGSDSPFTRISGANITQFLAFTEECIILVSKDDCEPCDRVRKRISSLVEQNFIPEQVMLAEVYGPEYQDILYDDFDVVGAPTILFCTEGQIELRLLGDTTADRLRDTVADLY